MVDLRPLITVISHSLPLMMGVDCNIQLAWRLNVSKEHYKLNSVEQFSHLSQ